MSDTVTIDQMNASLMNKSIIFFKKKKKFWPQTFKRYCTPPPMSTLSTFSSPDVVSQDSVTTFVSLTYS